MKRDERESKKELAYLRYMQGMTLKEICERTKIGSSRTINNWIRDGGWKEKRAAKTITRTELINKTLQRINDLLEVTAEENGNKEIQADKLSKLATLIEKLDKKNSPILSMDVFMDFAKWLQSLSCTEKEITLDFMKLVNKYQDLYITQKLNT